MRLKVRSPPQARRVEAPCPEVALDLTSDLSPAMMSPVRETLIVNGVGSNGSHVTVYYWVSGADHV